MIQMKNWWIVINQLSAMEKSQKSPKLLKHLFLNVN